MLRATVGKKGQQSTEVDETMQSLCRLTSLTRLRVASRGSPSPITDLGLQPLSNLTCLRALDLRNCNNITDQGLQSLCNLVSLEDLILWRCSAITDQGMQLLSSASLTSLKRLHLYKSRHCKITDQGVVQLLSGLTSLESLTLAGIGAKFERRFDLRTDRAAHAMLMDLVLQASTCLTSLTALQLGGRDTSPTDVGLQSLSSLSALTSLDFRRMGGSTRFYITDLGVQSLSSLTALTRLSLRNCISITDLGKQLLASLTGLTLLRL